MPKISYREFNALRRLVASIEGQIEREPEIHVRIVPEDDSPIKNRAIKVMLELALVTGWPLPLVKDAIKGGNVVAMPEAMANEVASALRPFGYSIRYADNVIAMRTAEV